MKQRNCSEVACRLSSKFFAVHWGISLPAILTVFIVFGGRWLGRLKTTRLLSQTTARLNQKTSSRQTSYIPATLGKPTVCCIIQSTNGKHTIVQILVRVRAAKEHRYYKSSQQNDEVILIKCFDTKTDRARGRI